MHHPKQGSYRSSQENRELVSLDETCLDKGSRDRSLDLEIMEVRGEKDWFNQKGTCEAKSKEFKKVQ